MITIFNSKSVYVGYDMKKYQQVCDKLRAQGIRYKVKVRNRAGSGFGGSSLRGRTGSFGMNPDYMYEYEVLVHNKDYERCRL